MKVLRGLNIENKTYKRARSKYPLGRGTTFYKILQNFDCSGIAMLIFFLSIRRIYIDLG